MDQTYLCVNCEKEFMSGDWYGCRGNQTRKHFVEPRTFYSINDRLCVNAIPSYWITKKDGSQTQITGSIVTFMGGQYHTADPELQEILAVRCPLTKEQYIELRTTDAQKAARLRQKVDEQAVLIAELKAKVAAQKETPTEPESPSDGDTQAEPVMAASGRGRGKGR